MQVNEQNIQELRYMARH